MINGYKEAEVVAALLTTNEVLLGAIADDWALVPPLVFSTSNLKASEASAAIKSANWPPTETTFTVSEEPIPEAPQLNKSSAVVRLAL